jgi:hypothetical protein
MKRLLLFVLLASLATAGRAQGTLPVRKEDGLGAPTELSLPASFLALTTSVERPRRGPLLVVNGQPLPDSVALPPAEDIIGLRELEPAEAVKRYGPRAARGALLIETERRKPGVRP